jgi:hypothetical protein
MCMWVIWVLVCVGERYGVEDCCREAQDLLQML